jgi:hypothetical protein
MKIIWTLVRQGAIAGLGALFLILLVDRLIGGAHFGLRTLILAFAAGGFLLLGGLGMALSSYWLATQGLGWALRQRFLRLAIFCGTAGLLLSVGAVGVWMVLGHPVAQ